MGVQGYPLGQEEVAKLGAVPKMLALLKSTSETVKERAAQALLVGPVHAHISCLCPSASLCKYVSACMDVYFKKCCTSRIVQHHQ